MKPRSFIAFFAFLTMVACIGAIHYMEAVSGLALVVGVVIGAALGLSAAMGCVRRYSTEGGAPPQKVWMRILIYAVGVPLALLLSDKLPSVPGVGSFVRTGGWVVFLVMGATASVGVGTWWRYAGALGTRQ